MSEKDDKENKAEPAKEPKLSVKPRQLSPEAIASRRREHELRVRISRGGK